MTIPLLSAPARVLTHHTHREVTPQMINGTEFLFVVERKYLQPETRTGPNPNEVMPPIVLVFDQGGSDAVAAATAAAALGAPRLEDEDAATAQYARPALRRARA